MSEKTKTILVVLALFVAGFIGYKLGSDNMSDKWVKASQEVVPVVIDYVMERYGEDPALGESRKDLIRTEGVLLFITGIWYEIDPGGMQDYIEKFGG